MMSHLIKSYSPLLDFEHNSKYGEPFYQGQLDVFCSIYAVLNALKITHNISAILARNIFHETLIELALHPEVFNSVLEQKTDCIFLIDKVLSFSSQIFPINTEKPFMQMNSIPTSQKVYNACHKWLDTAANRAIVLRYLKYMSPDKKPISNHWTTIHIIENDTLHFFDCCNNKHALQNIKLSEYTTGLNNIDIDHLFYIQPQSIRFVEFAS